MQMNDYYKIFGLKYKYTAIGLLKKYFEKAKIALENNNKEEFIKIRMGFEVLRNDVIIDSYNRIYRKYILDEEVKFPKVKEEQMISEFKEREQVGAQIAEEIISKRATFFIHQIKFFLS